METTTGTNSTTEIASENGPRAATRRVTPSLDMWSYLDTAFAEGPALAWRSPDAALSFVAWGALEEGAGPPTAPLEGLAARFSGHREQLGKEVEYPMFVGGHPFRTPLDGATGWGASQFWRPRCLVGHRRVGGRTTPFHVGVDPSTHARRPHPTRVTLSSYAEPSADRYVDDVAAAVAAIRAGALDKVVLARSIRLTTAETLSPASTFREMAAAFPHATIYAVAMPSGEVLCGATPELIASVHDGVLETQAVAGTGRSAALLHSDKDRHEHDLVIHDIVHALVQIGVRATAAPHPQLVSSGNLFHLVTPIRAALPAGVGVLDVVAALHPTAALCGAPREPARRWIEDHEPIDRGWYGGPIGWVDGHGNGTFAVALRCALFSADRRSARCYGGAGIVADSCPELERDETAAKMDAAMRCLRGVG